MILCFDIGGSRIRAALDREGTAGGGPDLHPLGEVATPAQDAGALVAALAGFVPRAREQGRIRGIAISIAGVVDPADGRLTVANIPGLNGRALAPMVTAATGLPALVLNDADCFAMAEAAFGAGRGHGIVFGIILGTGVGGGLVIGGQVVQGAGGFAGEWGHGPVLAPPHALPCGCGQTGCIDTVGGARGLERLHLLTGAPAATAEEIVAGWADGKAAATATLMLWRDLLSGPLAMVVNTLGPAIVPVGGGLARAPGLVSFLDDGLRTRMLRRTDTPLLVPATAGAEPGLLGAAAAGRAALDRGLE